ncbi:hypothetical protein ABPG72_001528 [Tetrahymena utriculariae]
MAPALPTFQEHKKGYLALLGGFLIHIMIGTFYLWGNINIYVTSYLRYQKNDVTTDILNSTFPFMGMTMGFMTPFGLDIAKKYGIQKTTFCCSLFFSLCSFVASFQTDYLSFTLIYGLLSGIASGIVYMIPYYVSYCHFPQNKGLVSGVISAGFGFSTFVFSWIVYFIANPDNVHPIYNEVTQEMYFPDEVSVRIPDLFRILSFIFVVIGGVGSYLCVPPPEDELHNQQENENQLQNQLIDQELQADYPQVFNECQNIRSGLQTPFIYISIILMTLYGAQGNLIMDNFKPIGSQIGKFSDAYLTWVGSIGSLFNGFIRLLWGRALDKYGFKNLAFLNLSIELFLMLTFYFSCQFQFTFIIWVLGIFACFGGWSAKVPALLAEIYGKKIGTMFYGITVQGFVVSCWLQFFIVQNYRIKMGWFMIFMLYSVLISIGLVITKYTNFHIDWQEFYSKRSKQQQPKQQLNSLEEFQMSKIFDAAISDSKIKRVNFQNERMSKQASLNQLSLETKMQRII